MILKCSGEQRCIVVLPHAHCDHVKRFLSEPKRTMNALLSRDKLQELGDDRFVYVSRPYRILNFNIQPKVVFLVEWTGSVLSIVFESCKIAGLDGMEEALMFNCTARLNPDHSRIIADAEAVLSLNKTGAIGLLPDGVLLKLGEKVLDIVFERLQGRCQRRLKKAVVHWLKSQA